MRVTNKMLTNSFLADMKMNLQNLKTLEEQGTSGKRFKKPSDDPFKVARSMQLHTDIDTNKQYNRNIQNTINWLDTTDTSLGQVGDVLQRVRELLVSAGNAGYGESERRAVKDEINQKIGEVSQILNTNFDGAYIFGGTRGTTKPVDVLGGSSFGDAAFTKTIKIDTKTINTKGDTASDSIVNKDGKLKKALGVKIEFDKKSMDITIEKEKTPINSLSDLAEKMNKQINDNSDFKGKIKAVPNIAKNTVMFVNINESGGETKTNANNNFKISSTGDITIDKATAEFTQNNTENTRLIYHQKVGGELVDGNEYNQINSKLKVEISQGVTMDYNVNAVETLEFKNQKGEKLDLREILNNITNHLDGKKDDGTVADADAIEKLVNDDLQKITDAIDNVLKLRAEVGAKQNRMDSAKNKNVDESFNMTQILSKNEDIDITEHSMKYATMISIYMASLQTSAKVMQPTLVEYLR